MSQTTADWPARTVRRAGETPQEDPAPVPGVGSFAGDRWFYVWNRDPLGECCCWRGTVRRDGTGAAGSCGRPGKHPWITRSDGQLHGFVHGAADAGAWEDVQDRYGPVGGARQAAVTLADLIVLDLDSGRAVRDFARLAHTVPGERLLGVSGTPRGYHVWLDAPGWGQRALNRWMTDWLAGAGGWHGTDEGKAGRRGLCLDVRTGDNRFAVWPGGDAVGVRRWIGRSVFWRTVVAPVRDGLPPWRSVYASTGGVAPGGGLAPWLVDTADAWTAGWIADQQQGAEIVLPDVVDGETGMEFAWAELERWLQRLARMAPGAGRNNALNSTAYFSGSACVAAGWPLETVRARLVEVGAGVGTHGVAATVESGLRAGVGQVMAQLKTQTQKAGV